MNNFRVIEERGCSIEYTHISGVSETTANSIAKSMNWQAAHSVEYMNGNGDAYTYRVEADE
jgi:hypothetical protein